MAQIIFFQSAPKQNFIKHFTSHIKKYYVRHLSKIFSRFLSDGACLDWINVSFDLYRLNISFVFLSQPIEICFRDDMFLNPIWDILGLSWSVICEQKYTLTIIVVVLVGIIPVEFILYCFEL